MSETPCTGAHPTRITFERRRSDFERDARVTPFTGSCCCCCCCLHWIGAVVGGAIGMRAGWATAEKNLAAPLPPEGKRSLNRGIAFGILLTIGVFVGAGMSANSVGGIYLMAIAFVPPLALIPFCAPLVFSAYGTRQTMLSAFRKELAKLPPKDGSDKSMSLYRAKLTPAPKTHSSLVQLTVFCRHCWCDLHESMHLEACPECNQAITHPVISGPDYGVSIAWRASLLGIAAATGGTAAGYLLMLLLSLFIR